MGVRILVVDDNPQMRSLLRHMLQIEGHELSEAADGLEALERGKEFKPHILIIDIIMPGKEGFETIINMRKDYPELKIIAISGGGVSGPEDYLKCAEELGANRSLAKPLSKDKVLKCVKELLSE